MDDSRYWHDYALISKASPRDMRRRAQSTYPADPFGANAST